MTQRFGGDRHLQPRDPVAPFLMAALAAWDLNETCIKQKTRNLAIVMIDQGQAAATSS